MAIEKGDRIRATCMDGEEYEGILHDICIGIDKEEPTQASIIIEEDESENMKFGQAHLWCNGLKKIEKLSD